MINPTQGNQPPSLMNELFVMRPFPIPDPVPWIFSQFFSQFEESVRRELVTAQLEMYKDILVAQVKATDRAIAAISKRAQTTP